MSAATAEFLLALQHAEAANDEQHLFVALARIDLTTISFAQRQEHWRKRAAPFILRLLREEDHVENLYVLCWDLLTAAIQLDDAWREEDSTAQLDNKIETGMIDALGLELRRNPIRPEILRASLVPSTSLCLCECFVDKIIHEGLIEALLAIVQRINDLPQLLRVLALISLTNLAIHPSSHSRLLESGALQVALGLLRHLSSLDPEQLDCGLSAAFLICRVAGRDECGPGMESIHSNLPLISKLHWILDEVLKAGPNGIVLGSQYVLLSYRIRSIYVYF